MTNGPGFVSARELLNSLFEHELADEDRFDREVVELVRKYLGQGTLLSRAGARLAEDLVRLAKARAKAGHK